MNIESPVIPYNFSDLEPAMSRDTVVFHFLRHQRVCYDRLCAMLRGSALQDLSLEELIRRTERRPGQQAVYRHAAEVWNHNIFWRSMSPHGGGAAHGAVAELLRLQFGSYEGFVREFKSAAHEHFGSGWLWVVWHAGEVRVVTTGNAGTPLVRGGTVLLGLDLWEHAYYLDHQNRRSAYVSTFLDELVNWDGVNQILASLAAGADTPPAWVRVPADAATPGHLHTR